MLKKILLTYEKMIYILLTLSKSHCICQDDFCTKYKVDFVQAVPCCVDVCNVEALEGLFLSFLSISQYFCARCFCMAHVMCP